MGIRVFCAHANFLGYQNDPVDMFSLTIPFDIYYHDGGAPMSDSGNAIVNVPLGGTAAGALADVYAAIKDRCAALSWPEPQKHEIYGYMPETLSQLLPDLPAMA